MISPEWRFFQGSGMLFPDGPQTYWIVDWDQRREIAVRGYEKALPDGDVAVEVLRRHIDHLCPDVRLIQISDDGDLFSVSSNPEDDPTIPVLYPRYDLSPQILAAKDLFLTYSQLTEVDRFGPAVDLVRYKDNSGESQLAVFKYAMILQLLDMWWSELHIMNALPRHELIVPFDRIILDDNEPRVLGFTVPYIPGGTFADNQTRPFRFSWLKEITSVVDDLNTKFGIMHQDIAPRNLVVDPTTGKIRLFDFGISVKIGSKKQRRGHDDIEGVIFTIYEILTLDEQPRLHQVDVREVEEMVDWNVKVPIEEGYGGVTGIRQFLKGWAQGRRTKLLNHSEASMPLDWFEQEIDYKTTKCKNKQQILCWHRPASKRSLEDGGKNLASCSDKEQTKEKPSLEAGKRNLASSSDNERSEEKRSKLSQRS